MYSYFLDFNGSGRGSKRTLVYQEMAAADIRKDLRGVHATANSHIPTRSDDVRLCEYMRGTVDCDVNSSAHDCTKVRSKV